MSYFRKLLAKTVWLVPFLLLPQHVFAFGVSPAIIDLVGQNDTVLESVFDVVNTSSEEQMYYFRVSSFVPDSTTGAPSFSSSALYLESFPSWITLSSQSLRVPSRSRASVPFSVAIPAGIPSESAYAAIIVSRSPADVASNASGASVEASTAVLLFLNIDGEGLSKIEVVDIRPPQSSGFLPYLSGTFDVQVQNQGELYGLLEGEILLQDIAGRTVRSLTLNEAKERLLPGATKTWSASLGDSAPGFLGAAQREWQDFIIGPVKVDVRLHNQELEIAQKQMRLWIIPWHLGIMVAGGVGIVLLVVSVIRRGLRFKHA